jgi:hypothetical protein
MEIPEYAAEAARHRKVAEEYRTLAWFATDDDLCTSYRTQRTLNTDLVSELIRMARSFALLAA